MTANPGPVLSELHRTDPQLSRALPQLELRLIRILAALLAGWSQET